MAQSDDHFYSIHLTPDGVYFDPEQEPITFENASVTLIDQEGQYQMHYIPFSAISSEELVCMYVLHEECKTVEPECTAETRFTTLGSMIEPYVVAQIQMNFMANSSSDRALQELQGIYNSKWGHDYSKVGKWKPYVRETIDSVYILRSSYPFVTKYLTLE
jgi:hypothetical protein